MVRHYSLVTGLSVGQLWLLKREIVSLNSISSISLMTGHWHWYWEVFTILTGGGQITGIHLVTPTKKAKNLGSMWFVIRMDLFTFACFTNSVLYVEGVPLWEFRKIAWNDSDWALVSNRTKKN